MAACAAALFPLSDDARCGAVHQVQSWQQCNLLPSFRILSRRRHRQSPRIDRRFLHHHHELRACGVPDHGAPQAVRACAAVPARGGFRVRMADRPEHEPPATVCMRFAVVEEHDAIIRMHGDGNRYLFRGEMRIRHDAGRRNFHSRKPCDRQTFPCR